MLTITMDERDPAATALEQLWETTRSAQHAYKERYDALPAEERVGLPEPLLETREQVCERVIVWAASALNAGRPPNCVLSLHPYPVTGPFHKGQQLHLRETLPIGAELVVMEATREQGSDWDVHSIRFGSMNLLDGGSVPLSSLLRLTCADLLSPLAGRKTMVDVDVYIDLTCRHDTAEFDGYRLLMYREEQSCLIAVRLTNADCDHPPECVSQIVFVDAVRFSGPYSPPSYPPSQWRCGKCGRRVQKTYGSLIPQGKPVCFVHRSNPNACCCTCSPYQPDDGTDAMCPEHGGTRGHGSTG